MLGGYIFYRFAYSQEMTFLLIASGHQDGYILRLYLTNKKLMINDFQF
jgi:hypothetical protein